MELNPRKKKQREPIEESAAYESTKKSNRENDLIILYDDVNILLFESLSRPPKKKSRFI